jgi:hypothetical protein
MRTVTVFNPQIFPSSSALASLSFLDHPVSSVSIDHRPEDLRMAKNRHRSRKVRTKQSRRMSFVVEHSAMPLTDLNHLMGRRPGDINRCTP